MDNVVSAVILAFNRRIEALKTIDILKGLKATLPFELEIIVVDNASSDNTSAEIQEKHPDVKLISRDKNNGVAGWNDGFNIARGKYLLVLDDDSHINSGLIEAVKYMDQHSDVGILAFSVVNELLQGDPNLDPADAWKDGEDIAGFIGCGALIRHDLFEKIGGFSEWLFIYTHEFDYAIRCLNAGYKIRFFEKGIVVHRSSQINRTNKRLLTFSTRNEMGIVYKYFKNQKSKYLFRILMNNLKLIKRDGIAAGYYIIQGAWQFFKMRKTLQITPVSGAVQDFYANNFSPTQPVLRRLKRKLMSKSTN